MERVALAQVSWQPGVSPGVERLPGVVDRLPGVEKLPGVVERLPGVERKLSPFGCLKWCQSMQYTYVGEILCRVSIDKCLKFSPYTARRVPKQQSYFSLFKYYIPIIQKPMKCKDHLKRH